MIIFLFTLFRKKEANKYKHIIKAESKSIKMKASFIKRVRQLAKQS